MRRAYKFRLYPKKEQEETLAGSLDNTRFLYNGVLEKCIAGYKKDKRTIRR